MKKLNSKKVSDKVSGKPIQPRRSSSSSSESQTGVGFPIVGIGASAGGLEAIRELLSHTATDTGMAFVVMLYLDSKIGSNSVEILAKATQMRVSEIKEGTKVKANHVFVVPSNCISRISHGVFKLFPRTPPRSQYLPLDFFFQALAEEQKTQAIGIVLSGNTSDGTQGLRAIKDEGGITLAQDPGSAKYDTMPRSAIALGAVDLIRTTKGIGAELARIARHPYILPQTTECVEEQSKKDESLVRIFTVLKNSINVDFTHYKKSTIQRRITRRMLLQKTDDLEKYSRFLENNPEEIRSLFADILIHVTGFFRDKKVFEALKNKILPKYIKTRDQNVPFRVWVPGCSTGEEAYSIAMTFIECFDIFQKHSKVRPNLSVFATDISEQALKKARAAIYPESIREEVSKERLRRFFERVEGGGYRIVKWLRDTCLFSQHDVTSDPPFAKVDLISCRNLLIYLDSDLQRRVLPIFHYALNPNGILLLGRSETVGSLTNLFSLVDKSNRAFSKKKVTTPLRMQFPVGRFSVERLEAGRKASEVIPSRVDVQRESDRISALEYSPPSVVINDALEIVQSRGRTSSFLELPTGHASLNILRMAHPELIADLRMAIQTAKKKDTPVLKEGLCFHPYAHNGLSGQPNKIRTVDIRVIPIPAPSQSKERYFIVFFEEVKDKDARENAEQSNNKIPQGRESKRIRDIKEMLRAEMQKKLSVNKEYQQSLIEEYETTQEELVSSNEELQSTNEELQSTNEELETAKEELQSANDELTAVNDEMQTRNMEITLLNNDLTNLLASVDIPIVMVGPDAKIRRFTPKAAKAVRLIASDVGRPIGDIKPDIQVPDLDLLVSEVMETMNTKEIETQDKWGHWYNLQVRPYRTADKKVDGAVISLLDIDAFKQNAEALQKARDDAATIIESQPIPLLVIDCDQRVKLANEIFYEKFEVTPSEIEGRLVSELGSGQWKNFELQRLIDATLSQGVKFQAYEVDYDFPKIGRKIMILSSRRVQLAGSGEFAALLAIDDVTERLKAERGLKASEEKYRNLISSAHDGVVMVNEEGKIEFANPQVEKMFGFTSKELLNQSIDVLVPILSKRNQLYSHPEMFEKGTGLDLIAKRKDGSEFPVDISFSQVETQGHDYVTAIIRDISERKEVEKQRTLLFEKERKANIAKDEFLAILSHELRTPLTTILSWAQMLRSGKLDPEKMKRGIEIVEQSARAQGQLIDDLLDISRIQAGKMNLLTQEVDPTEVIAAAIDSTRSLAALKSIQIETIIDPSVEYIYADPTRLQQILWNLITNSIKFSSPGEKIWIKLNRVASPMGEQIRFQVCDLGKGIKPECIPIIFERFSQVDSSSTRVYGGLGLGLAIVQKLVEMHHGFVEAESPGEGKGATFSVSLPLDPSHRRRIPDPEVEVVMKEEDESKAKNIPEETLVGLRLLVVDDEANAREVFTLMLQSLGAEVKAAESASQALAILEEFKPHVLISDIAMPMEDGYSFIGKVRALKSDLAQTPAIALTAFGGREDVQRIRGAGFQAHVAKPVEASKLVSVIARLASDNKK